MQRSSMTDILDHRDIEILKSMKSDSRKPMGTVGENQGISKATVSRRVARLEEEGVIRGYCLDIDHGKIGVMKSLVAVQIMGVSVSVVLDNLKDQKEIGYVYKSFGDHHFVFEMYTRNVDDLYDFIQAKLLKMPAVRNVEVDILVERFSVNENPEIFVYETKVKGKE